MIDYSYDYVVGKLTKKLQRDFYEELIKTFEILFVIMMCESSIANKMLSKKRFFVFAESLK